MTESRENDPWTVEDKTFTYQINSKKDEVPPQLISIELFKDENCTKPLTSKPYSDTTWEESDYEQNHVNKVYAKASGKDAGGIFAVNVKEKLLKNTDGNDTTSELHEKTFGAMSFQNTEGVYSAVVEIDFQEVYDGLVNLELSLTDFAGNKSDAVKYDVIKDTMVDVSIIKPVQKAISYKSIQNTTRNLYYDDPSFIRESSENVDVLILQFNTLEEKYFGEHKAELESFEVYYGYANDKYSMTQAEYIAEGNSYKITRDKNKNTYILYSAVDAAGNETEIFRIIPKSERLVNPKKTKDYQDNSGNPENYFEFSVSNYESMKNSYNQMGMSDYGYYCLYQYKDELPKRYRYDLGQFDYKPYTSLKDYSSLTPKFYFSY
ncbi:MAG: hypothetical protein HUK25_06650, partial [Treponema sp.]|nr:hypothetical protein [Treponema sp.]